MEGKHGVPIEESKQASGLEDGGLPQGALRATRFNPEIEQRLAGQTHLRAQRQGLIVDQVDYSPEIERVSIPERIGIPPSAP